MSIIRCIRDGLQSPAPAEGQPLAFASELTSYRREKSTSQDNFEVEEVLEVCLS